MQPTGSRRASPKPSPTPRARWCLVGYDNERGKGDHKHINGTEYPYIVSGDFPPR